MESIITKKLGLILLLALAKLRGMNKTQIRRIVLTSVFTALISAGAFAVIPIGPVPIVLTTFFVTLSGLLGGFRIGVTSVIVYLILGILGLPVFAGGGGGFAVLTGPTGGYLIGYLLAASFSGLIFREGKSKTKQGLILLATAASLTAAVSIYIPGLLWLKLSLGLEWEKALSIGLFPFIPGDLIKAAAAVALTLPLKDRFVSFLKDD